jgi:tetratricopeptide (TPR) repeat protein
MNERDITLLNDYFNGLLSPEDARAVETRAASDPAFGEEFDLRRAMEVFPRRAAHRQALKDTLATVETDFFGEETGEAGLKAVAVHRDNGREEAKQHPAMTAWVSRRRWLAVAASVALAVAAIWFVARPGPTSYRRYAQHTPLSLTVRGDNERSAADAERYFAAGEYADALAALNRFLEENPDDISAQLYTGICLIEIGRPAEARSVLAPVAAGASALRGEATWYIALSFLKEKNTEACKAELLKIAPADDRYGRAQELLQAIQ